MNSLNAVIFADASKKLCSQPLSEVSANQLPVLSDVKI